MTTPKNQATADALPDAGEKRWWRISHAPRRRQQPITVELWEITHGSRRAFSQMIGFEHTIAQPDSVAEAAKLVLEKVALYEQVIGEYPILEA